MARASLTPSLSSCGGHGVEGADGVLVLDEVAQLGVLLFADGRLQRDRGLADAQDLPDLAVGHAHLGGDLLGQRLAAHVLQQLALHADELVDLLDHVHRDADGAGLVGDGPGDGLPDPPGGVGGELVALAVVELLHRADEAQVALLDEVEEAHAVGVVALGDGDDQAQVGLGQLVLGPDVAPLDALGQRHLLLRGEELDPADLLEVHAHRDRWWARRR